MCKEHKHHNHKHCHGQKRHVSLPASNGRTVVQLNNDYEIVIDGGDDIGITIYEVDGEMKYRFFNPFNLFPGISEELNQLYADYIVKKVSELPSWKVEKQHPDFENPDFD